MEQRITTLAPGKGRVGTQVTGPFGKRRCLIKFPAAIRNHVAGARDNIRIVRIALNR